MNGRDITGRSADRMAAAMATGISATAAAATRSSCATSEGGIQGGSSDDSGGRGRGPVVQEGQVSRLRVDDNNPMRAVVNIVGYKKPIGASVSKIAVLADSSQRWWNPDLREYPVEVTLDETPPNIKPGLGCQVEILVDRRAKVLGVPLTSVYSQGAQSFVFVREGQGMPKPVEVKSGEDLQLDLSPGNSTASRNDFPAAAASQPTPPPS